MKVLKLGEPPNRYIKASERFQIKISRHRKAPNKDFEDFGALERSLRTLFFVF
jgi:hypothetical protein